MFSGDYPQKATATAILSHGRWQYFFMPIQFFDLVSSSSAQLKAEHKSVAFMNTLTGTRRSNSYGLFLPSPLGQLKVCDSDPNWKPELC